MKLNQQSLNELGESFLAPIFNLMLRLFDKSVQLIKLNSYIRFFTFNNLYYICRMLAYFSYALIRSSRFIYF